ncbi:RepB family plasmid replication initiator protein [uncultured Ligilactobacillus sp.]|uniref:RepB family plasmid replication initiator protein n=1 Tax=uncultured Ligilactobacillus sp. TaxID=2837633 RepID=UPI00351D5C05
MIKADSRVFRFGQKVAPYIFHLKERFYVSKLSELSQVRSKYAIKPWNTNAFGK